MNAFEVCATRPIEVFPAWLPSQRVVGRHTTIPLPSTAALRSRGFLPQALASHIADWYAGPLVADAREIEIAYQALADEVAALARAVTAPRAEGGLGVRVTLVQTSEDPYANGADLCGEIAGEGR